MELVNRNSQEDILGLTSRADEYRVAKRIIEEIYGKDVKIHQAPFKDIRGLLNIIKLQKEQSIYDFYQKL